MQAHQTHQAEPKDNVALYLGIALLSGAVFVTDLYTALGITVWVFYLAPMALTMFCWKPSVPIVVAAVEGVLVIAGVFLSPPGGDTAVAGMNRTFGVLTVWVLAGAAWYVIRGRLAVHRQAWLQSAQTAISEKMAGEQSVPELGRNVLRFLAEYLGAGAATFFVQDNGSFSRRAEYAVPPGAAVPEHINAGEGLVGQAIRDGRTFVVSDVPDDYFAIGSTLGQSRPRHLLIAPAMVDGAPIAVLEFGFFQSVSEAGVELIARVSSPIAMSVRSALYRAKLQDLLDETQRQAEELQAQGEELRSTNEELEQQSEALQESQSRLEEQQTELEQTNAHLEEQTDILERQRDELVHAKEEIEEASRYKSEFLASMSHELRTPLNSALILARLLVENKGGNLTQDQVEYARTIESSGNTLLALINNVLDLAKVESGRMEMHIEPASISKLAETMKSVFQPLAEQKQVALEIRVAADLPSTIETDPQRLVQVLSNLLANAVKFTEQGRIVLSFRRGADACVCFEVQDTGVGIPEDQQELIFEPFRQGDSALNRKYAGTGLGLSICRELVRHLGGEIQVKSRAGEGSTFTVTLPERHGQPAFQARAQVTKSFTAAASAGGGITHGSAAPPPLPMARAEDDRERLTGDRRSILVVEDDLAFAYILRDLTHEQNFQCLIATTSAEALALARQCSPSAVILDVGLPDGSGLSVLDRLKLDDRTRHIPVHVVSVHDYTERALSLGAVGYALKPVRREQLIDALQKLEARMSQKLRRVLIVEDDAVQRESVERLLGSPEVELVAVSTAAECLDRLRTTSFDCMVLDLSLPDESGLSLLDIISREERYSFPPVIVHTARDLTAEEEQHLRRYSKSIIIKGAKSPERLLDEVTLFLHRVVSDLPLEQQRLIEKARRRDSVLEGRHILLAEDDVRNIFALTSLLEPHGAKLLIARNGREAIEVLERSSEPGARDIDLVLMDIMMPEMDGLTATREIRKKPEWKKLPIIALTAKAMKNDYEQAIAAGANDYMAKPLDVDQFLSMVRVWMPR